MLMVRRCRIFNTAALSFGGYLGHPTITAALNESWNGSTWTEVNNLNTARSEGGGHGSTTSALAILGEEYLILLKQKHGMDHHGLKLRFKYC